MKGFFLIFAASGVILAGCSSDTPQASDAQKKAFLGSAPPKGYMDNIGQGQKLAQDAAQKAAAQQGAH